MGQVEAPDSWKIVKLVSFFLNKNLTPEPKKGIWKNLHVGGIEGISCQHIQVMMRKLKQKHWEWQEDRRPMIKHGSMRRPTMYLASMGHQDGLPRGETKAQCTNMEEHNVHGLDHCSTFT